MGIDGFTVTVNRDNNGEADGDFRGGHDHNKNSEDLSGEGRWSNVSAKGDHQDIDRVEHQLNRNKDHNGVAPGQSAVQPYAEKEGGQN